MQEYSSANSIAARDHILIIGAMKGGTTALFSYLSQHPEIAPAQPKEPGFFAFEDQCAEGLAAYDALFHFDAARHRYTLDGSTDYAKFPYCGDVPARLREAMAAGRRFKLLYILRHPMRRIESHARHTQHARKEIGQIVSPITDFSLDAGISPVSLAISHYATQLDQYETFRANGDLLVLTLEELSANPEETLRRVLAFLDLDPEFRFAPPRSRNEAGKKRHDSNIWIAASRAGWLNKTAKAMTPKGFRRWLRERMRVGHKTEGRFRLTAEEESALLAEFGADLRRLRDHYGVEVERLWGLAP